MADSKQIDRGLLYQLRKASLVSNKMRIVIWVLREDIISNNITGFHVSDSEFKDKYDPNEYVQVIVSRDEFVKLENNINNTNDSIE